LLAKGERNMSRISCLAELLDAVEASVEKEQDISVDQIFDEIGHRSFGPFLLAAGLVLIVPGVGDIPGVTSTVGLAVLVVGGQILLGQKYIWLPRWLRRRTVSDKKLCKAIGWLRKPAGYVDRLLKVRLTWLTTGKGALAIAAISVVIALTAPLLEVIVFSAILAGAALTGFGLALVGHDGLFALLAYLFTALIVLVVFYFSA
jgi:hypothetical protein